MLWTGGETNLSKPVCSKGNNPTKAELQLLNFSLLKLFFFFLNYFALVVVTEKVQDAFSTRRNLTFPQPYPLPVNKRKRWGGRVICSIDYTLVAFACWLWEPEFRHFVHINIYKYFCLLMECLCMIRTPVQNDEGWLRLRKWNSLQSYNFVFIFLLYKGD